MTEFPYFRCMGFLFPLFLLTGIVLIIPVLIHLFNLRRYKHVFFSNTRFLQQLQVASKKSAQLQKKWLLLTRLLFLAALIMAFAKPYIKSKNQAINQNSIHVIYLDNSLSMLAKKGQETLLEKAKIRAIRLIESLPKDQRFLILNNDKMTVMRAMNAETAQKEIAEIKASAKVVQEQTIMNSLLAAQENERNESWNVYLFSDFQKSTFLNNAPQKIPLERTRFFFLPVQQQNLSNVFVDTAWFEHPSDDNNLENQLIIQVKKSGVGNPKSTLRVEVGNQTRAVLNINEFKNDIWKDTVRIRLGTGWQKVSLSLNDFPLNFDDTFRMALRPAPSLSILVIGEGGMEAHLRAALQSYAGFSTEFQEWRNLGENRTLDPFSLIILQNVNSFPGNTANMLKAYIENGGSVLLFPGDHSNKVTLNSGMKVLADISFGMSDSSRQIVSDLQKNHPLVKELFEKIPENVQLPTVTLRFPIQAGLAANQQSIFNFRDGSPFFAQYGIERGKLFLFSTPLGTGYSDLVLSPVFVPFLYQMAMQSQGDYPASISIGSTNPLLVKTDQTKGNRSVWHLKSKGFDAVPVQRPSGSGVQVFLGEMEVLPGYYYLQQENKGDSILLAFNAHRQESEIGYATRQEVMERFKPFPSQWIPQEDSLQKAWQSGQDSFPLWKVFVLIALVCLVAETILLLQRISFKKKNIGETNQ